MSHILDPRIFSSTCIHTYVFTEGFLSSRGFLFGEFCPGFLSGRFCPSPSCHNSFIHSFIYSSHFYSAPSSPLPLRGAPDYSTDTVSEFHAEAHRQLQVKDLPKVPT